MCDDTHDSPPCGTCENHEDEACGCTHMLDHVGEDRRRATAAADPRCELCMQIPVDGRCDCDLYEGYKEGDIIIYGFDRASALRRWKKITGGKW